MQEGRARRAVSLLRDCWRFCSCGKSLLSKYSFDPLHAHLVGPSKSRMLHALPHALLHSLNHLACPASGVCHGLASSMVAGRVRKGV
jgi:hypothetical protein